MRSASPLLCRFNKLQLSTSLLQAVQDLYEECQATFDPNNIAGAQQTAR